jgi:DNA-binding Xre family transcriptional regulator
MKIDVDKVKSVLLDKTVPASLLEKTIGVNKGNISKLRNGQRSFENLTIETAMKVQKWIDDNQEIIITVVELRKLKDEGKVIVNSPVFRYTDNQGLLILSDVKQVSENDYIALSNYDVLKLEKEKRQDIQFTDLKTGKQKWLVVKVKNDGEKV